MIKKLFHISVILHMSMVGLCQNIPDGELYTLYRNEIRSFVYLESDRAILLEIKDTRPYDFLRQDTLIQFNDSCFYNQDRIQFSAKATFPHLIYLNKAKTRSKTFPVVKVKDQNSAMQRINYLLSTPYYRQTQEQIDSLFKDRNIRRFYNSSWDLDTKLVSDTLPPQQFLPLYQQMLDAKFHAIKNFHLEHLNVCQNLIDQIEHLSYENLKDSLLALDFLMLKDSDFSSFRIRNLENYSSTLLFEKIVQHLAHTRMEDALQLAKDFPHNQQAILNIIMRDKITRKRALHSSKHPDLVRKIKRQRVGNGLAGVAYCSLLLIQFGLITWLIVWLAQ